jgi:hypothetical protein
MSPESEDTLVEPFRVTPGFFAFVGVLIMPALAAVAVYFGAWLVADDVYAAEQSREASAAFTSDEQATEAAGWKRTLVGVCPLH